MNIKYKKKIMKSALSDISKLEKRMELNLNAAAEFSVGIIKESIRTGYPPASTGGQPPHARTGNLLRSIDWMKSGRLLRKIGSGIGKFGVAYPICLEYGTVKMAARPYLRPVIARTKDHIARILSTP